MFTMKPWIVLSIMLALCCQLGTASCAENKLLGSPQPVDATYFGLHIHHIAHPTVKTPWPDVKFGSWRLWDAYVAWPNLEPKKGEWDFTKLDKYVELAGKHHVEILLPLGLSPQWASARPDEKSSYEPGNAAEPKNMDDWRNYVRTVATRYKGRVHHYELWNEVNMPSFYSGTRTQLVDMAREAHKILKDIDPTIIFVSPSFVGNTVEKEWLDKYLQEGGGEYADVIGYHFYVSTQAPEAIPSLVSDIKKIMAKNGVANKPLWNTETGWLIDNSDGPIKSLAPKAWKRLNVDEATAYVARALILGRVSGLDHFYWYAWDNAEMGLYESGIKKIKPAGIAYGQVSRWLMGNVLRDCTQKEDLWVCTLSSSQGETSHIAWTTSKEKRWIPPSSWSLDKLQTLDGQEHSLVDGEKINLTQSPLKLY